MKARSRIALALAIALAGAGVPAGCNRTERRGGGPVQPTCASVEVLHTGVAVHPASGPAATPRALSRVEAGGRVVTTAVGRAVVRTDEGLELRLAGDTEVVFPDGTPRVERGRVFVSSWGEEERAVRVGPALQLRLGDAAVEIERGAGGEIALIAVRGEVAFQLPDRQGRLQQGEALAAQAGGAPRVVPAGVWDDWTGGAASPQGVARRGARGAGQALIHAGTGEAPAALAVNEHHVSVRIEGDVAFTRVAQRFFNGADATAPVEYRVRLPDGAIVAGFAVERDGSELRGVPGTVAALSPGGGRPALLAAPDGGLYARLDPLAPGQTVRCVLEYVEWLAHEDGGRRAYVYPMGDPASPPFVGEFVFELATHRANVAALRGPVGARVERDRLRYARSDFRPRSDLRVDLFDEVAPEVPSARVWLSPQRSLAAPRYALVDVSLPPPPEQSTDLVVVVDASAGTDAGTLDVARAAVNAMLHQLGPTDRIALMFGDLGARPAEGPAGELAPATPARREAILGAISRARPGGASNLQRMLAEAYGRLDPRRNGAVVYVGDAMPTMGPLEPGRLLDETLRVAPDLRLYVLAVGADAHPEVLAGLAERGGRVARADDSAAAVAAANELTAHALRPVLRDVAVRLGPTVAHPLPAVVEQLVAGDPLRVVGELTGNPPERVTIEARVGGEARRWTVTTRIDALDDAGDIRRRWALARVRALEGAGASRGTLADLGVRFGLITPTSALVLAGAVGSDAAGYEVAGSLWPDSTLATRLPRLGVGAEVAPRGVRTIYEAPEYPMVTDDESGWRRHYVGENAGATGFRSLLLAAADNDARACFERSRALRPSLAGAVTVAATVAADGRVTEARVVSSTLNDVGAESCVRRAVAGLHLPALALFGAQPGVVTRTFDYAQPWVSRQHRGCPPSSRLPRDARVALWRERIAASPADLAQVWTDALWRCELRVWEDRVALIHLLAAAADEPERLASVRRALDGEVIKYFDRVVARRFGPSRVWRAYLAISQGYIDWDALVRRLNDAALPVERKIELARAYLVIAPGDIDLRLRLMALYEQAGRRREARRVADELRTDPYADTRVRALVGEMLIRAGDRAEGLRALSEIAEHAPYDTGARASLGDLLLTYGGAEWAGEAYLQFQTLAALLPGDPLPRVRVALAALVAQREDEALRILRGVAEDTGGDAITPAVEALLVAEVARLAAARRDDPAAQNWVRVAQLMRVAREGGVLARWSHPDVRLELRAQQPGDTAFVGVGEADAPLNVRLFAPGAALEGSRLLVRAAGGVTSARTATARLAVLQADDRGPRLLEREVTLTADRRVAAFVVRNGALVEDGAPIPESERPPPMSELY